MMNNDMIEHYKRRLAEAKQARDKGAIIFFTNKLKNAGVAQ